MIYYNADDIIEYDEHAAKVENTLRKNVPRLTWRVDRAKQRLQGGDVTALDCFLIRADWDREDLHAQGEILRVLCEEDNKCLSAIVHSMIRSMVDAVMGGQW